MNLKVADFGFATYTHGGKLFSYRGTKTYMAPEIRSQKEYDGHKVDIFSLGVILFITVMGIFPFLNADLSDPYYRHIAAKSHDSYWLKMGVSRQLSQEFRDLIMMMLSLDSDERLTVDEIRNHPWM